MHSPSSAPEEGELGQALPAEELLAHEAVSASIPPEALEKLGNEPSFTYGYLSGKEPIELYLEKAKRADEIVASPNYQALLVHPDVRFFDPVIHMDMIAETCRLYREQGVMSDVSNKHLNSIGEQEPLVKDAFLRDIARILKGKCDPWPDGLPQPKSGEFEDPLRLGKNTLQALAREPFTDESIGKVISPLVEGEYIKEDGTGKPFAVELMKKFPKRLSPGAQVMLGINLLNTLQKHEDPGSKALDVWKYYSRLTSNVGIGIRIKLFLYLRKDIADDEQAKIVTGLVREFFDNKQDVGIFPLGTLYETPAGKHIHAAMAKSRKVYKKFLQLATSESPLESAIALRIISGYIKAEDTEKRLGDTMFEISEKAKFIPSGKAGDLMRRLMSHLQMKLDIKNAHTLFPDHRILGPLPMSVIRSGDTEEIMEAIYRAWPYLTVVPVEEIRDLVERYIVSPQEVSSEFFYELNEAEIPADFDKAGAVAEIMASTSLPLVEPRKMDLNGLLGSAFRVKMLPSTKKLDSLGAWSLTIKYTGFRGKKFVNQAIQLDFDNCQLISEVPNKYQKLAVRIGIYCGHQFFVKQQADPSFESKSSVPQDDEMEDTDADLGTETEPARNFGKRDENPLTIDISDEDHGRIKDRRDRIRHTMTGNKRRISKLVNDADYTEEDVKEAIIHRIMAGSKSGQPIYERVPSNEVMEALLENKLLEKNWYFLNTLPHIKNLGYKTWRHTVRETDEDGVIDPSQSWPIWLVSRTSRSQDAELRYLCYADSGFPDLSDFSELDAWLGVNADAVYDKDNLVDISTQDEGEVIFSGTSTHKDHNAALAIRINSGKWMQGWLETQIRVLQEEIEEIYESGLPEKDKLAEITAREAKIEALPEQIRELMQQTGIKTIRSNAERVRRTVRLTIASVPTETTFNQGNYLPIGRLKKAEAAEEAS